MVIYGLEVKIGSIITISLFNTIYDGENHSYFDGNYAVTEELESVEREINGQMLMIPVYSVVYESSSVDC